MKLPDNFTFDKLATRAMRNALPRVTGESPRWVAIRDTFAVGSTTAIEICTLNGLDPHETVMGAQCLSCEP